MISIRKFVAYAGGAAGVCGALLLATSASTGIAGAPPGNGLSVRPAAQLQANLSSPTTLSPACTAAFQKLKSAVQTDRTEDGLERSTATADPDPPGDTSDDASELAGFRTVFAGIRTGCAPAKTSSTAVTRPALSNQCAAAIATVKAFWAQGRPTTQARWMEMFTLLRTVRAACGWTESDRF